MNDQVNRTVVDNELKGGKKCYSVSFLKKNRVFLCGFLDGVLILSFVRLCLCQLISASRVVALTGSGSIKVVFRSVHLLVWDEAQRMAVTRGGGRKSRDIEKHHYDGTCAFEPRLSVRERGSSVLSESSAKCERKLPGNNSVFFLMCDWNINRSSVHFKRREQFLGQCIKTKMKHLAMEKVLLFFFGHFNMDDEWMNGQTVWWF